MTDPLRWAMIEGRLAREAREQERKRTRYGLLGLAICFPLMIGWVILAQWAVDNEPLWSIPLLLVAYLVRPFRGQR